ncbi:MAG: hypothetical protein O7E52_29835 [Candidatus Poribacteria bacterium]|nr:hypothetical protein [Candidatus Poribacteria bacterium]
MNLDCKRIIEDFSLHRNPDLTHREKAAYKQHLVECVTCRAEYEEMLYTAAVLESLPEPVPPPDLAQRIQTEIRQTHRRSVLDFLVNPIARILVALKLGPHPTFVNYTAMLFYVMLTIFLVKLTFFGSVGHAPVALTKPLQPQTRIVRFADIKRSAMQEIRIEAEQSNEVPIQTEIKGPAIKSESQ